MLSRKSESEPKGLFKPVVKADQTWLGSYCQNHKLKVYYGASLKNWQIFISEIWHKNSLLKHRLITRKIDSKNTNKRNKAKQRKKRWNQERKNIQLSKLCRTPYKVSMYYPCKNVHTVSKYSTDAAGTRRILNMSMSFTIYTCSVVTMYIYCAS